MLDMHTHVLSTNYIVQKKLELHGRLATHWRHCPLLSLPHPAEDSCIWSANRENTAHATRQRPAEMVELVQKHHFNGNCSAHER